MTKDTIESLAVLSSRNSRFRPQALPRPAAFLLLLAGLLAGGCGPSADAPLPSEDDLLVYCRALARKAQAQVPEVQALALFNLGRVEQRFGLEDNALEFYESALKLDRDFTDAYLQIGFILSQRNERHPEAIEAYQQAIRTDPNVATAYTRIGLIYLHHDKLEDAERVLREEIRLGKPDDMTYYNLGQALALQKKHEDAVKFLRKSIELEPRNRMAYYALSQSLMAIGKTEESHKALEDFRKLKKEEDDARQDPALGSSNRPQQLRWTSDIWMDAARLYAVGRNRSSSIAREDYLNQRFLDALREAIRFDPKNPAPQAALLDYHENREDFVQAAGAAEKLLRLAPTENLMPRVYKLAGRLLKASGEQAGSGPDPRSLEASFRLLKSLTEVVPGFPAAHRELARVILFHKSEDKKLVSLALRNARQAVELQPSAANYDILAFAQLKAGQIPQARKTLEEGIRRNPDSRQLQLRLKKFLENFQKPPG